MGRFRNEEDTIRVDNAPDDLSEDKQRRIIEFLKTNGTKGLVQFKDAESALQGQVTDTAKLTDQDALEAAMPAKTTLKGAADSFVRKFAPTLVATAFGGLPGAAVERLVYAVSPAFTDWVNEKLKLTGTKWEQWDSQQLYDYLHDQINLENPDTFVENLLSVAGTGAAEGLGMAGLGAGAKTLGTAISRNAGPVAAKTGQIINKAGQWMADLPVKEAISSGTAAAGGLATREAVKDTNMPEIAKTLAEFGGAMFSGLAGSKLDDIGKFVQKVIKAKGSSLVDATKEVIDLAKEYGIDVLTSDWVPRTKKGRNKLFAREMASGGTSDLRGGYTQDGNIISGQDAQRVTAVNNLKDKFNVPEGTNLDNQLKTVSDDFWAKRDGELNAATTARDEVFESLSQSDVPVPTPKANALITDALAKLEKENTPGTEALQKKLYDWQTRLSDTQTLPQAGSDILPQDKSIITIEAWREKLGEGFKSSEGVIIDDPQKISNQLYKALRADMGEYVKEVGDVGQFRKFEGSMAELSRLSDDFNKKVGIPTIMNSRNDTPIKAMSAQLFNNSAEDVLKIYQRLTPTGQANARAALITKMLDESTDLGTLSPNEFARKLKDYGGQRGILFSGEDSAHLEGLKKVLEQTSSAEASQRVKNLEILEGTPGVSRGIAGFILKHPIVGISTLLGSNVANGHIVKFIERPAMRDLLLKFDALPNTERFSTPGQELLKRMGDAVRGYLIAEDSERTGMGQPKGPNANEENN